MDRCYLVRYGLNSQVGRFSVDVDNRFDRGESVVIRSWRGTELGEVLIETGKEAAEASAVEGIARILRRADNNDHEQAKAAESRREQQFNDCSRLFEEGTWPIELIDVEPLLDDRRTVLHYLGPHKLDTAGLLAAFRSACNLDVMFQPVGLDLPDEVEETIETEAEADADHGCGSCGSKSGGGCGTGGGGGGGCGSCAVKKLIPSRR